MMYQKSTSKVNLNMWNKNIKIEIKKKLKKNKHYFFLMKLQFFILLHMISNSIGFDEF